MKTTWTSRDNGDIRLEPLLWILGSENDRNGQGDLAPSLRWFTINAGMLTKQTTFTGAQR
jgi:hypothetical protein